MRNFVFVIGIVLIIEARSQDYPVVSSKKEAIIVNSLKEKAIDDRKIAKDVISNKKNESHQGRKIDKMPAMQNRKNVNKQRYDVIDNKK
jgi:predicted transcriptional regulator